MQSQTLKAIFLLNIGCLLWAGNIILGRWLHDLIGPWSIISFRVLFGGSILLIFLKVNAQVRYMRQIKNWWPFILMSISGIVAYQGLLYYGLHWTSSINTGLINGLMPFVTGFFASIYLKDRLDSRQWFAACLSIAGLIMILTKADISNLYQLSFNKGDILISVSVLCWVIYSITGKLMMQSFPPLFVTAMSVFIASIIVLPLGVYESLYIQQPVFNNEVLMALIFIGIGPTVLSLLFWNKGVQLIGPSLASLFLNTVPLYTILLTFVFLDEQLYLYHFLGLILIVGASLYASLKQQPVPLTPISANK